MAKNKRSKTISVELSKKGSNMATDDQNNQQGDSAADESKKEVTAQEGASGNVSEDTTSDQDTNVSDQQDTMKSSDVVSSTEAVLAAGIIDQEPAVQVPAPETPITPAPVPEVIPATPAVVAPVVAQTTVTDVIPATTLNPVSDLLNQNLLSKPLSFKAQIILDNLKDYMEGMKAGKPVPVATQVKHQRNLHSLILQTINDLEEDEFRPIFTKICKAFDEDPTGCFADTHVYRAWGSLNLTGKARQTAEYLIKMMMTLGPTKGRAIAKNHISVEQAMKNGFNERGRHRVIDFFDIK